jgi:alkanesulfonate monooxygenase SsuD/methylene tetrahydromethanopterin reductase-like flavin-dependent oxidoreductase (luciferase family)
MNVIQHRELPDDFAKRYHSNWVDLPFRAVATPEQYSRFYWSSIEEMLYAVDKGFDAVALNEHHQTAFGGLPNPNVFGGALAYATRDKDVALVQLGSTLPTSAPPNRVAEEYAMLDVLSGGRLVAGMPVGTPMDGALCYGLPPLEQRERYAEAHELIIKAWTSDEMFAWNGKYFQLPCVNVWPRPIQQPHPPVWVPGTGSTSTWDFVAANDYGYMVLTAFSGRLGITDSIRLVEGFWDRVEAHGHDRNPFRAGVALIPLVGESMAQIERDYFEHIHYFFNGAIHTAPEHLNPPGYTDFGGLVRAFTQAGKQDQTGGALDMFRFDGWTFKDYVDNDIVVAGTPEEVAQKIEGYARHMNAGHLMVMMQIGSMPKELTMQNIDAFAEGVLPRVHGLFEDEWENKWWPERLRKPRADVAQPVGATEPAVTERVGAGSGRNRGGS